MSLDWSIYISHSFANPAQSLNNICPGDLMSSTLHTSRSQEPLAVCRRAGHNTSHITTVILNLYSRLHDLRSKGDNPILRSQCFHIDDDCHKLLTYSQKPSQVKHKTLIYIWDIIQKRSQVKPKIVCKKDLKNLRLRIRIRSENHSKGVELRFEYDHIAPSGFGVADQEGTDSFVVFGSNTTYLWTGSPYMTLRVV